MIDDDDGVIAAMALIRPMTPAERFAYVQSILKEIANKPDKIRLPIVAAFEALEIEISMREMKLIDDDFLGQKIH